MKQKFAKKKEAGFTIVELVFVMVVLSVLVSIATLTYSGLQAKATKDLAELDLKVIQAATRTYYLKHGTFPAGLVNLATDGYLDGLPKDKFEPNLDYSFDASDPNLFKIWSRGPNGIDDGGAADDLILTFSP